MQDTKSNTKLNLSEYYKSDNLSDLFNVFPKLKSDMIKGTNSFSSYGKIYVDKFSFYQMILEKIKNYFEINESFIISKAISIILNDIKSIIDSNNSRRNKNFHMVNKFDCVDKRNNSRDEIKIKRALSTKSNGKNKINERIKRKEYNIFNDFEKEKNLCDINNVYMNLYKNNQPKIKLVHFMNEGIISKNVSPANKKKPIKSNLKKTKSKRELDLTNTTDLNNSNLKTNEYTSRTRKTSFKKTKTENYIRNKSNGIKFQERESQKTNMTNYKINQEILYDDKILTNPIDNNIEDRNFDIFKLSLKVGKEKVVSLIGNYIFTKYNFSEFMNISKFRNWCEKISKGYINTNYYHNSLHAADITHTCYFYFQEGLINEKIGLNPKSLSALFLSCICHDYKHPGVNNNFLIETKHPLSIKYNDVSVLENMHISETFKLINEDINCNIFENMDNSEYKIFRKQMISCVLSTDMVNHGKSLNFLKKCLKEDFIKKEEDNQDFMDLLIHSADISNPTKTFEVYYKWAKLVVEEFYYQGDKEKELGLKCSCDRNKVTLYKSQLGFIDYIINPFFGEFIKVFPKLNYIYDNVEENRKKIKQMEDEDNKNKK